MNLPRVYTCSHPEPPSHLLPRTIPLGHPNFPKYNISLRAECRELCIVVTASHYTWGAFLGDREIIFWPSKIFQSCEVPPAYILIRMKERRKETVVAWLKVQEWGGAWDCVLFYDTCILMVLYAAATKSLESCPTLCDPIDCSPPGSPVPGVLQVRTLEWVAISFSNAWKWKVKVKSLSCVWLFTTPWTVAHQAPQSMGFSRQEYQSGLPFPSPWWFCIVIRIGTLLVLIFSTSPLRRESTISFS